MTEKRFTLHKGLDTLNIMDNTKFNEHIYINKSSKDMKLLVGVLNAQHEEIQSLKKEIENNIDSFKRSRSRRIQVEEENEQLKQQIKQKEDLIDEVWQKYEDAHGMSIDNTDWF